MAQLSPPLNLIFYISVRNEKYQVKLHAFDLIVNNVYWSHNIPSPLKILGSSADLHVSDKRDPPSDINPYDELGIEESINLLFPLNNGKTRYYSSSETSI